MRISSRRSNRAAPAWSPIEIATFTEQGILLKSGKELEADIVVTATGLVMQASGGAELWVDGRCVDPGQTLAYKGVMMSGVPNLASVFGYINSSWTLKADLICAYVCRLLNFMDAKGVRQVTPRSLDETAAAPFVENFTPGYIATRAGELAEAGFEIAVACLSELHPRHDQPEVEPG